MGRLDFQRGWAQGLILNVGSGENPVGFGADVVQLDLDLWRHPISVQGDAHRLPFRPLAFDTCVLGDIMEHLLHPAEAVEEACRVGRRVVLTVFREWRLAPRPGQYQAEGLARKLREIKAEAGFDSIEAYKAGYAGFQGRCLHIIPEARYCHDCHINQFDEAELRGMVPAGMRVVHWELAPEATWQNWLIVLEH